MSTCAACGVELAPGMLACPACRKLVHGTKLTSLREDAEAAERDGRLGDALCAWRTAQDLLPRESAQHAAVAKRITRLSEAVDRGGAAAPPGAKGNVKGGAAGLGAAAMLVWKLKFVVLSVLAKAKLLVTGLASLPTLLSMAAWVALGGSGSAAFVIGLVVSIYVHEMGHVAALRGYGIAATAPMFIPGLGAVVRLHQYPADAREDARVGLAGPVWGTAAAILAAGIGLALHSATAFKVASLGATINLFNLVPFWQLDGARGFRALGPKQRGVVIALAAVAALAFDQKMGWAVCAIGSTRATADLPPANDTRAFRTFALLVVLLPAIAWACDRAV